MQTESLFPIDHPLLTRCLAIYLAHIDTRIEITFDIELGTFAAAVDLNSVATFRIALPQHGRPMALTRL